MPSSKLSISLMSLSLLQRAIRLIHIFGMKVEILFNLIIILSERPMLDIERKNEAEKLTGTNFPTP